MADDSGQRLLDVIGDPSALDEFLGALTADSVPDNVVESLARSLAAEFAVDSPNETLFDSSSANLTDLSQSTVPFDFESNSATNQHGYHPGNDYHNATGIQGQYSTDDQSHYGDQGYHLGNGVDGNLYGRNSDDTLPPPPPSYHDPSNSSQKVGKRESFKNEIFQSEKPPSTEISIPPPQKPHPVEPTPTPPPPPPSSTATTPTATHVYVTTSTEQAQYATSIGHLVQQNAAVLAGMNSQLALNSQPFIIDPTTGQPTVVMAQGNTFGTTNLLVAGVQPTYTMPLFSNTITMQPQIQAIKTAHGTTTGFLQATTTGSGTSIPGSTPTTMKPKAPPQLLPKPNTSSGGTTPTSTSVESESQSNANNVVVTSSAGSITMTTESLSHILQQQQQTTVANALGQPSYAIGAGGQVVQVSGMQTLNSISGSQIFMNQFGQQMLVPTAMSPGVQFIVRQQPQTQMLTIQAPTATQQQATTASGKVVRFVQAASQVPQVTQNSIQLQQIQTAQGTTWVAVRSAPVQSQPVVSLQAPPVSPAPVPISKTPTPPPPPPTPPQPPPIIQVTTDTISATIQSVIERLKSPSPPLTSTVPSQYSSPVSSTLGTELNTNDHHPPPKKKPKYSKKKVTLDLEQLLKQSGIMDEDLEDDGGGGGGGFNFGDFFGSQDSGEMEERGGQGHGDEVTSLQKQNGVHNNNNNTVVKDYYKQNGVSTTPGPVTPFVPTVPTHSHILKPSTKSKQRKNLVKVDPSQPMTTPQVTTPGTTSKKSKKKSNSTIPGTVIKIEPDSIDPLQTTPKKSKSKKSSPTMMVTQADSNSSTPVAMTTPTKKWKPKKKKNEIKSEPTTEESSESSSNTFGSVLTPIPVPPPAMNPVTSPPPPPPRRIVQTIQLTPQNQTLLRNIQAQIQKLLQLTSRNENEETALQNFISLQAQVIKTGTPVPNPPHLQTLNSTTSSTTTPPVGSPQPKVNGTMPVMVAMDHNTPGGNTLPDGGQVKGQTNLPPPPLIPNKGCGKVVITNSNGGGDVQQKIIVFKTPTICAGGSTAEEVLSTSTTSDEEITSSTVSIMPTTTISTVMSVSGGRPVGNGMSNGVYCDTFDHDDLNFIDEKKLEEQLRARLEQEEESRIRWRREEFEKRLSQDHQFFVNPDYKRKFKSVKDSTERLMHFHVGRDTAEITFEEFDDDFAETSVQLLNKFSGMVSKYRALLLKESMKDVECAERVMLERMFVGEEKLKLEHDRGLVQQGEILDLPPPPPAWLPRIRSMVEAEVKEIERDSLANQQVQSAIDSIMSFEPIPSNVDDKEKIEYDAFGVPISSTTYSSLNSSSADIDEAVRSILL